MLNWIMQLQLLLAALSTFLPLAPSESRERIADVLDAAAKALAASGAIASNIDDLAVKLAAVRAEVEAMVAAGRQVTADELDVAMARVRAASADFRAALETADAAARG